MTKRDNTDDNDRRSEEVADIIERFPGGWTTIVSLIMAAISITAIAMGFVIQYPDTVIGRLSITGMKAPVRIVAVTSGRLHLMTRNSARVERGDCIGYIESGADYNDIMTLDSLCDIPLERNSVIMFPGGMTLGSLAGLYNDLRLAYSRYDQVRETRLYDNMRRTLANQKASAMTAAEGMRHKIEIHRMMHAATARQYRGDSILHVSGAMSDEALEQKRGALLASQLSGIEYAVAENNKRSEIGGIEMEIAKTDIGLEEDLRETFNAFVAKRNVLADGLREWKNQYLFISPIDGTLEYLGFWRESVFVNSGREVFSVLPRGNRMIGEMYMSVAGAGKVERGQYVNVKLADYPYNEYGYVRGRVRRISTLTGSLQTADGLSNAYLVEVEFPDGLTTNFGKRLSPNYEATGVGEVITKRRRLIERLFDNLRMRAEK